MDFKSFTVEQLSTFEGRQAWYYNEANPSLSPSGCLIIGFIIKDGVVDVLIRRRDCRYQIRDTNIYLSDKDAFKKHQVFAKSYYENLVADLKRKLSERDLAYNTERTKLMNELVEAESNLNAL